MTHLLLVPVRGRDAAKTRLAALFTEDERMALMWVMLRRLVDAAHQSRVVDRIIIVTRDAAAVRRQLRDLPGLEVVEQRQPGLNGGLADVLACLHRCPPCSLMMLSGDLPLIASEDIRQLAERDEPVALVPDRDAVGTNAVLLRGAAISRFRFAMGPGSLASHEQIADAAGFVPAIVSIPGICHDLDRPEDWAGLSPFVQRSYLEAIHRSIDEARWDL